MPATLDRRSSSSFEDDTSLGSENKNADLERRRQALIDKFHDTYFRVTFDELGAASLEQTIALKEGLNYIKLDEEEIRGWEKIWDTRYVPMMASAHKLYYEELMDKLLAGYSHSPRFISKDSIAKWSKRFKNPGVSYKEKEAFIRNKLPAYITNWKRAAEERVKLLNHPDIKSLTEEDVPDIKTFFSEDAFLNMHFSKRENMIAMIRSCLFSKNKNMNALYKEATKILEKAAAKKAMSRSKIGVWLGRIFREGHSMKEIEEFVYGKGSEPLTSLIQKWSDARDHYYKIEKRRKKEGSPQSFHFVEIDVFLDWHYERRLSYIEEADKRFEELDSERVDFLVIRHELDAKNWDEAKELIEEVKKKDLSDADKAKLDSMERFLREHGDVTVEGSLDDDPVVLVEEINEYLNMIPEPQRTVAMKTLRLGFRAFWAYCTLWYNRVWCHQHHYLDEEREMELGEEAKELTPRRIKDGHATSGLEVNDLTGQNSQEPAIRDQEHVRAPQILITGNSTDTDMLAKNISNNAECYNFWYWTSLIDKNISFKQHEHIVSDVHPGMKRAARKLAKMDRKVTIDEGRLALL